MANSPVESKSEFDRVANVVATQWALRDFAKRRPEQRNSVVLICAQLRQAARAPRSVAARCALAENVERLLSR